MESANTFKLIKRRNLPRVYIVALGALSLLLVGLLDWTTGPVVSFLVFYFIPVCVFSWYFGLRIGIVTACVCAVVWFPATYALHDKPPLLSEKALTVYWNLVIRAMSLSIVAVLVHACKRLTERVETLVAEKTASLENELSEQRKAERAIRQLSSQLATAESQERRRLAQELHDTLGQDLSALKLTLQALHEPGGSPAEEETRIHGALQVVNELIQRTRTMTFELHPPMLDDLGLVPTLQRFAQRFSTQTGVQVEVAETGERGVLPSAHRATLFRAVKELVHNAARHGKAGEVIVSAHWQNNLLRIVVDDDGRGFAPERPGEPHAGLGLAWIQERLENLGGSFLAESAPDGSGARIILTLKLETTAPSQEITA
jgi:signal transduction histidine kinase